MLVLVAIFAYSWAILERTCSSKQVEGKATSSIIGSTCVL